MKFSHAIFSLNSNIILAFCQDIRQVLWSGTAKVGLFTMIYMCYNSADCEGVEIVSS
jgi:hypothetical protein